MTFLHARVSLFSLDAHADARNGLCPVDDVIRYLLPDHSKLRPATPTSLFRAWQSPPPHTPLLYQFVANWRPSTTAFRPFLLVLISYLCRRSTCLISLPLDRYASFAV